MLEVKHGDLMPEGARKRTIGPATAAETDHEALNTCRVAGEFAQGDGALGPLPAGAVIVAYMCGHTAAKKAKKNSFFRKATDFFMSLKTRRLTGSWFRPKPRSPLESAFAKANPKAKKCFIINNSWLCANFTQSQQVLCNQRRLFRPTTPDTVRN
jgi:hypothetical protein